MFKAVGLLRQKLAAQFLNLGKGNEPGVIVIPQAAIVPINDMPDFGYLLPDFQQFVALFLVFRQDKTGVAVVHNVGNFVADGVGEQAYLNAAHSQQRQIAP